MTEILNIPTNPVSKEDRKALEAFGGHEAARGRATRFHWRQDESGDPVFELYKGGAAEELVLSITRDRTQDLFVARDAAESTIVTGTLDHVMAAIDRKLASDHGEENPA